MKPRLSLYSGAILNKVKHFHHQLGHSKEEEGLRCMRSFAKAGWKLWRSGNRLWGLRNGLWLANRYRPRKGHWGPSQKVLQAYRGKLKLSQLYREAARKTNVLGAWEASLQCSRSCGVRERAPRKGHCRPPRKGEVLML